MNVIEHKATMLPTPSAPGVTDSPATLPVVSISAWLDDHEMLTEMAKSMYEVERIEYDEEWKDQPRWCHKLWRKRAAAAIKAALKKSSNTELSESGANNQKH